MCHLRSGYGNHQYVIQFNINSVVMTNFNWIFALLTEILQVFNWAWSFGLKSQNHTFNSQTCRFTYQIHAGAKKHCKLDIKYRKVKSFLLACYALLCVPFGEREIDLNSVSFKVCWISGIPIVCMETMGNSAVINPVSNTIFT